MTTPLRLALPRTGPLPRTAPDNHLAHHLHEVLAATTDPSSWSDDLALMSGSWTDRYHFSPARANVLRALARPTDGAVLEIGARGGALTRYLGETHAVVDALEPDAHMAAVVESRCAGLDSVAVHTAWIDALPPEPAYDLVVAIDVADLLQQRGQSLAELVEACSRVLLPGGRLVLAFDNTLGVRFLAGHVVESLGDAGGSRPPRLTAEDATAAVTAAGLRAQVLHASPDHRHTHALFDHDALAAIDRGLLLGLTSLDGEVETSLWHGMVADGTSGGHASSFVVVASADASPHPDTATYWSVGRSAAQSAANRVRHEPGGDHVVVDRARAFPLAPAAEGPLRLRPHVEPFVPGTSLVAALADAGDTEEAGRLLRGWVDLVEASTTPGAPIMWDLIPRNVIVQGDGTFHAIDQEFELDGGSAATIIARGCFWLGHELSQAPSPSWLLGRTLHDRVSFLHAVAGQPHDPSWFESFLDDEATHVSYIWPSTSHRPRDTLARESRRNLTDLSSSTPNPAPRQQLQQGDATSGTPSTLAAVIDDLSATNSDLRAQIDALKIEQRHAQLVTRDHLIGINAELEQAREQVGMARRGARRAKARATAAEDELKKVRSSTTWRIGRLLTRPLAIFRRRR